MESLISVDEKTSDDGLEKAKKQKVDSKRRKINHFRYAYRALKQLTRKDLKFPSKDLENESSESSSSSESIDPVYKIRKRRKEEIDPSTYKNIHEKLKTIARKYFGEDFFPEKKSEEIKTIVSTTRSTSGSSTKFQNTQFESKNFSNIPSIKIYPRNYSDKCLPCLYKTFQEPQKSKTLTNFPSISERSSESVVTIPDLRIPDLDSLISSKGSKVEPLKINEPTEDEKSETLDTESVLSKDHSLSPMSTDLKKVSIKSGSAQSTDISKPSTPSGQSSESEDARADVSNEALDISKYLAPCHAPLVWKPSLESLKALRLRKATSMQSRVTAIVSKSLDDSDLEDNSSDISTPKESRKDRKTIKSVTIQSPKADSKSGAIKSDKELKEKRKTLERTKTIVGEISKDKEKKGRFIRSKTSVDLTSKVPSRKMSFDPNDSAKSKVFSENFAKLKEDEEKPIELSTDQQELLKILENCLNEEKSCGEILKVLCDWYSVQNAEIRKSDTDPDLKGALKISLNLLRLLAESRRYLNSDKFSPDLEFSLQQPLLCNSRQLRRVLPLKLYNKVAPILNMPVWYPKNVTETEVEIPKDAYFKQDKSASSLSTDLIVSVYFI